MVHINPEWYKLAVICTSWGPHGLIICIVSLPLSFLCPLSCNVIFTSTGLGNCTEITQCVCARLDNSNKLSFCGHMTVCYSNLVQDIRTELDPGYYAVTNIYILMSHVKFLGNMSLIPSFLRQTFSLAHFWNLDLKLFNLKILLFFLIFSFQCLISCYYLYALYR